LSVDNRRLSVDNRRVSVDNGRMSVYAEVAVRDAWAGHPAARRGRASGPGSIPGARYRATDHGQGRGSAICR